jgi:hypothetical protein
MTDQQVKDVRTLTRAAGIHPTTTRVSGPGHALLQELAPGERVLVAGGLPDDRPAQANQSRGGGGGGRRRSGGRPQGGGQGGRGRSQGQSRSGGRPSKRRGGSGSTTTTSTHTAAEFSRRRGR